MEVFTLEAALPRKLDPQNWELILRQLAVAK
jgi:hypothetical protein